MYIMKCGVIHGLSMLAAAAVSGIACYIGHRADMLPEVLAVAGPACGFVSFSFAIVMLDRLAERAGWCRSVGHMILQSGCTLELDGQASDCVIAMGRQGIVIDDGDDLLTIAYDTVSSVRRSGNDVSVGFEDYEGTFTFGTAIRARTVCDTFLSRCRNLIDVSTR